MTHSSPENAEPQGYTEAEGCAASLRQQADLMEKANAGQVSAYVAIDDFDVDELREAADFIERISAQQMPWPSDGEMLGFLAASGYELNVVHSDCYRRFSWKTFTDKLRAYASSSPGCTSSDGSEVADGAIEPRGLTGASRKCQPSQREGETTPLAGVTPGPSGAIMTTFIKKWFLGSYKGPVYLDCVNGEKAWIEEAKAVLALTRPQSPPSEKTDRSQS